MSSVGICQMQLRREMLAKSPSLRQKAISDPIADFILSTARAAEDLRKLIEMQRYGADVSPEAVERAQYLEGIVRRTYRKYFGSELGGEAEGAQA